MNIAGVKVGRGQPCRVVAEISNAHNGKIQRAYRLIESAKEAGADFVKFQCYTPDELVKIRGDGPAPEPWGSEGWTMRALYERAQTPHEWFPKLVARCAKVGIPWFSSVFGSDSLALLESLDCPAYKISAFEFGNAELREAVCATGKPVIRSARTPGAPPRLNDGTEPDALYCPPGYPQDPSKMQLSNIRNDYLGLSYHGRDPHVPGFAVGIGAKLLEVHIELDKEPSELESDVCLPIHSLGMLTEMVKRSEVVLG